MPRTTFGLVGYPLGHSFSKQYFTQKFVIENLPDFHYELFEIQDLAYLKDTLRQYPYLKGFNVTIPHKQNIIAYLDELDSVAEGIGAVNVVKVLESGRLVGYNSDYYGFRQSLQNTTWDLTSKQALILGTGGASKAVQAVLRNMGITYQLVSQKRGKEDNNCLGYADINDSVLAANHLIINTTPLGMLPHIDTCPALPYHLLSPKHLCFDLVYNPQKTLFLQRAEARGASTKNGLEMLYLQAEKAWQIWLS